MHTIAIRDALQTDAAEIAAIYNTYVLGSTATFELEAVDADEMARRIGAVEEAGLPWLVATGDRAACGYAYAAPWKARAAYARTVETSIYLAEGARGTGLGKRLYAALLERLRGIDLHVAIGGVALPNPASVQLHEGFGFEPVGRFREVGRKFDAWVDVGYWQLRLDAARAAVGAGSGVGT